MRVRTFLLVVIVVTATVGVSVPAGATVAPEVWVGSPFDGHWASSQGCPDAFPSYTCSEPAYHSVDYNGFDGTPRAQSWATDIGGPGVVGQTATQAGTKVVLYVAPQVNGTPVTTKVDKVGAACAVKPGNHPAGSVVVIGIYSGTIKVGTIAYAHVIPDAALPAVGSSINRWGSVIGVVGGGYQTPNNCWSGTHLHLEMGNTQTISYSCYNGGFHFGQTWGDPIYKTNFVGFVGGSRVSGSRQPCPAGSHITTAKAWGDNGWGELGDGTTTARTTPVGVSGLSALTAIGANFANSCGLLSSGTVKCWGDNTYGQLGDGTTTQRLTPVGVSGLSGVTAISTGYTYSCGLLSSRTVKCWGNNDYGQLGDGTTTQRLTPVGVPGLSSVTAISADGFHSCALLSGGTVKCWGYNGNGELGDGTTTDRHAPVAVSGLSAVRAIDAGYGYSCALLQAGTVKCWGYNGNGNLGDGTTTQRLTPVGVQGLSGGVSAINAGLDHSCALLQAGTVKCWGYNQWGELGDGTSTTRLTPVGVSGLSGVTAISADGYHSCALLSGGTVKCWGYNGFGELGDGTTTDRHTPVGVSGLSGVTAISTGWSHTVARIG